MTQRVPIPANAAGIERAIAGASSRRANLIFSPPSTHKRSASLQAQLER